MTILEVHRIVALAENSYAVMHVFYENLQMFAREQFVRFGSEEASSEKLRIVVQTHPQFLSFVYSTLGSPRDFGLVESQSDTLWNSLVDFGERSAAVRDDLFNWILAQARSKERHALSVEDFR